MILDLNEPSERESEHYDVCVIGSGPAGATVAAELASSGLRICVLESGRTRVTRHGDALKRVESVGIHIKDYSRERVLGGASTTWAGLSSPLDEIDMRPRPYLGQSGWPIERSDLMPYYEQAAQRYRFPALDFFGPTGFQELRSGGVLQPQWTEIDEKVFLAADEPQNFGKEQKAVYEGGSVDLYLDASVARLESEPRAGTAGATLACAFARARSGREVRIRARAFVVACGGIENARLLLNSRDACAQGLGNERDQVGRYLMNHPKNYHGILHLAQPVEDAPYYFGCLYRGYAGYAGLRLAPALQLEYRMLNTYVRLEPLFPWSDSRGVEALVLLVKRSLFVLRAFKHGRKDEVVELRDYSETGDDSDLQNRRKGVWEWLGLLGTILLDLPRVAKYAYYRLVRRAKPRIRRVRLRNFMEMEPDPQNRVTLSEERDVFGERIPLVEHRCGERDRKTLVHLHELLTRELEGAGVGRLESALESAEPWPIDQDASHHMGTTRMGADPAVSVVDADLRVHGVENVYVAGASVFPTSGCANPTFTIVALSIRLARHLERSLASEAATPEGRATT